MVEPVPRPDTTFPPLPEGVLLAGIPERGKTAALRQWLLRAALDDAAESTARAGGEQQ